MVTTYVSQIQSIIAFSGLPTVIGVFSEQQIKGAIVAPPPGDRESDQIYDMGILTA